MTREEFEDGPFSRGVETRCACLVHGKPCTYPRCSEELRNARARAWVDAVKLAGLGHCARCGGEHKLADCPWPNPDEVPEVREMHVMDWLDAQAEQMRAERAAQLSDEYP